MFKNQTVEKRDVQSGAVTASYLISNLQTPLAITSQGYVLVTLDKPGDNTLVSYAVIDVEHSAVVSHFTSRSGVRTTVTADGKYLLTAEHDSLTAIDLSSGQPVGSNQAFGQDMAEPAYTVQAINEARGEVLVTLRGSPDYQVLALPHLIPMGRFKIDMQPAPSAFAFTRDGLVMVAANADKVALFSAANPSQVSKRSEFAHNGNDFSSLAIASSQGGYRLDVDGKGGCTGYHVDLVSLESKLQEVYGTADQQCHIFALTPDGNQVFYSGYAEVMRRTTNAQTEAVYIGQIYKGFLVLSPNFDAAVAMGVEGSGALLIFNK